MRVRLRAVALTALSLAAFAACSVDHSTSVDNSSDALAPGSQPSLLQGKPPAPPPPTKVNPLHRGKQLGGPLTVSQTIGPAGGRLDIPSAGVTVTVPAGALLLPVKISMTALQGDAVAYEFAPHGLIFLKPVTIAQHVGDTKEKGKDKSSDPVELGYFGEPGQLTSVLALVDELRPSVPAEPGVVTASIWHFSGYVWSCGRR